MSGERVINMDDVKEKRFQNVLLGTDKGRQIKVDLVIPYTGLNVHTVAWVSTSNYCNIERFLNDCQKANTKAVISTNINRRKQRDEPIRIPSNYL